jgi:hypothetical protein
MIQNKDGKLLKSSFMLKNKILKVRQNEKELKETIYINPLKVSQTVPNSESNSNSDKLNMCNIGSKTESKTNSGSVEINSGESKNSQSQNDSMYKTLNYKNHLDPYINVKKLKLCLFLEKY